MKNLLFLLVLTLAFSVNAQEKSKLGTQEINWITIDEAQEAMKKEPRKIMMDVYTKWCGPCKMMMKNTFTNTDLIEYINKHYYAVKFDAESKEDVTFRGEPYTNPDYVEGKAGRNGVHTFSRFIGITAYPSLVYIDEELNLLTVDKGYKTAPDVEKFLRFFKEDMHLVDNPQEKWQNYNKTFVPTFKQ
ncbi:MAG: thioredoxin-related protein [Glaciecola sp.]|jgi:thioredoxin-related protein